MNPKFRSRGRSGFITWIVLTLISLISKSQSLQKGARIDSILEGDKTADRSGELIIENKENCKDDEGLFSLHLTTDRFGFETKWKVVNEYGSVLSFGNKYKPDSSYNISHCIPRASCSTFWIFDTGRDGICCDFGLGSYKVKYDETKILQGGKNFEKEYISFGEACGNSIFSKVSKYFKSAFATNNSGNSKVLSNNTESAGIRSNFEAATTSSPNNDSLIDKTVRCMKNILCETWHFVTRRFACNHSTSSDEIKLDDPEFPA